MNLRMFQTSILFAAVTSSALWARADAPVGATTPSGRPQADPNPIHPSGRVKMYDAEVPLAYYDLALTMVKRTAGFSPPVQARAYAYMGVALYESLVAGMPHHRSIANRLNGFGELPQPHGAIYYPLAASSALAEVMRGLWGDATSMAAQNVADIDALEEQFRAAAAQVPAALTERSILFGQAVGAAVFAISKTDGGHRSYATNFPLEYEPPVGPGLWTPTSPGQIALQPFWRDRVRTFVLSSGAECDPGSPPAYSESPGSTFYQDALQVYDAVNHLTPEQLTIARFWADGPGSISGPGHSLAIASQILVQENANLGQAAEALARVGIAVADAVSSCWWSKYEYNLIRPVTYIEQVIDPAWTTALPTTPPFPEYTSAHSVQSAAAVRALVSIFGDIAFVDHSHDADGFAPRSFPSLSAALYEVAISRVYAGIHFPSAVLRGIDQGNCAAERVNSLLWRK